jgi:hypothetical protein
MAPVGCGISHKDTKYTDKCSNNRTKTTQKQMRKPQINTFSYCGNDIHKTLTQSIHILYKVHTTNIRKKSFAYTMSYF